MNNTTSNSYEYISNIIEFYRIQPRIQDLQIEKVEEYLLVMNAHYQNSIQEIEACIDSQEPISMEELVDILNSYLNMVGEELSKIFPNEEREIAPIHLHSKHEISEIQAIELYRNFNGSKNLYRINEQLTALEKDIYEGDFVNKLAVLTEDLLSRINSDLIVKVDDLVG
ncbi:hypothetical protein BZG02_19940 [Labilibaculum filiforme]|uniref:Uncharacterized protein n=1 Tax=Labilibaculum filiforme TaxID=1940526 RepID=A0A2N3HQE3_9BACT|nr:hypothetical protein [Labilibaculum filiforme]PKQ60272.1 hypothetical protein BZG02_19940 [Labilibaculum filiforme]